MFVVGDDDQSILEVIWNASPSRRIRRPESLQPVTGAIRMAEVLWSRYPFVAADPQCRSWLTVLDNLGRSPATVDAYGRGLDQYLSFCAALGVKPADATLEHVSLFVRHLRGEDEPHSGATTGVSNATLQQRLTALRLWYDYLVYGGWRERNPVPRGSLPMGAYGHHHPGFQRGLVRRLSRLPIIPSDNDWSRIVARVAREGLRNRVMFALGYYGALRREELVSLRIADFDVARRLITVRPETSKSSRSRVVCYPADAGPALIAYLRQRRASDSKPGPMFLSESDRNRHQPISRWSWSKVIERIARQAVVPEFTTHTLRHLRLTHLARSGWRLHEIASYAGHRSVQTTMQYIHLSGSDLLVKMARSVEHGDAKLGALLLQTL
jgi:integrase/recombinase XerD